ncbi:hypothetical protein I5907_05865 [Panacibacter sp. DH6]|uniref:Uncharacterized protein n=1 Tax=Panacibacter microcysteis TaxID=2793269 RepID=A0A931E8M7_9BACT|nr:hypothetical protein [Panacibacter microcysteis]MBG9375751.1 hypothetical protein [Panacibacter microcysteis]
MDILNIFTPSATNIFFVSAVTGIAGFAAGFLIKAAAIAKHKKRVIGLEDEMLTNHSRILELEKQLAELKDANAKLSGNKAPLSKVELKAS